MGEPYDAAVLSWDWVDIAAASGVRHILRTAAASAVIAAWIGHVDASVTNLDAFHGAIGGCLLLIRFFNCDA